MIDPRGEMLRNTNVFPSLKKWTEFFTQPKLKWTPPPFLKKTLFFTLYSVQTCFGLSLACCFRLVCISHRWVFQRKSRAARVALGGCTWSSRGRQERTAGCESVPSWHDAALRGSRTRTTWSSVPTTGARYGPAGWKIKPPHFHITTCSNQSSSEATRRWVKCSS